MTAQGGDASAVGAAGGSGARAPGRVRDGVSVALFGLRRGIRLVDGIGRAEFASAHDPVPVAAAPEPHSRTLPGDPFEDPGRPLVLTLGSDCADLGDRVLGDLLSLARYPGVVVSIAPGLADHAYEQVLRLEWTEAEAVLTVTQAPAAGGRGEDPFAMFDSPAPTRVARPPSHATAFAQPELVARAGEIFDWPTDPAGRAAREAIAHRAIGNDYIVSTILTRGRRIRHAGWPNQLGACTPDEAFALAGLKSRMYASVPLGAEPAELVRESTGRYRDISVTHLSPGVWEAVGSALGPDALADEAACSDRLLAIRDRLADILIARDEVLRLARRDALGPSWVRPFDSGPVAGAAGGELCAHLAYHLVAELNAMQAIADNLAWIARVRGGEDLGADDTTSSLSSLAAGRTRRRETPPDLLDHLGGWPSVPTALSLLRMRNAFAHRDGVDYGVLSTETMTIPPTRDVAAVWIGVETLGGPVRIGEAEHAAFEVLGGRANLWLPGGLAAFTFPNLATLAAQTAVALTNEMLSWPAWRSPREWLTGSGEHAGAAQMRNLWRPDLHLRLWGLAPPADGIAP